MSGPLDLIPKNDSIVTSRAPQSAVSAEEIAAPYRQFAANLDKVGGVTDELSVRLAHEDECREGGRTGDQGNRDGDDKRLAVAGVDGALGSGEHHAKADHEKDDATGDANGAGLQVEEGQKRLAEKRNTTISARPMSISRMMMANCLLRGMFLRIARRSGMFPNGSITNIRMMAEDQI